LDDSKTIKEVKGIMEAVLISFEGEDKDICWIQPRLNKELPPRYAEMALEALRVEIEDNIEKD